MTDEWGTTLLRDLLVTTKDGDWGKENPEEGYLPYRIIRGTDFPDVRVGDLSSVPQRYLPEHTVKRRTLEPDDILIETAGGTRDRPTGRTLLVTENMLSRFRGPVTCASFARFLRVDRKQAAPRFVFWYLQHLYNTGEMSQHQVQHTGVARFQYTRFAETQNVPLPPLAEQKAIAAVLGALDDKIELNRRMNATLEAMARALFQSWFVDFDPVRAKMDGRKPADLEPATAALFPEHLEDSPLGRIPKAWEVRTIESVCSTVTRGVTPEYGEGTGRYIINQRVNRGSDLDWSSLKELSQGLEVPPERFAKRWDVFVNCLGEGTLGRTHLYKGQSDIYAIDQHMSICRAERPAGGAYIYQVLSGADGQAKIESLKTGSTGMTMFNISKLRSFELVWPSAEILAAYFKTVEPLWFQIANNDQESRTVATLRDTLLPKLLTGDLQTTIMP
jgi:type I restriction enzyme S subunit